MIRRHTANDYAITCEIEVDDDENFVRLIRAWGVDPAYSPNEPELPNDPNREAYAKRVWEVYVAWKRRGYKA